MKKSLIALAALAAAGAASAQSSVTLFGIVDAAISHYSVSDHDHVTKLTNSGYNSSRLGFRGTEDLGGGLSASFWLEGALSNDDGTPAGLMFQRRSTVSLAGNWGELRLGRDYTPTFWNMTVFDPFGTNGVGSNIGHKVKLAGTSFFTGSTVTDPAYVRASNMVAYFLPANLGGFYGQISYAFDEIPGNNDAGRYYGGRVGFASGPFNVAVAYGHTDGNDTAFGTGSIPEVRDWNVGGQWDFGMAKLLGVYDDAKYSFIGTDATLKSWLIGGLIPVGAGEIRLSYGQAKLDTSANDPKSSQWALGYVHNLSKRTALYATYAHVSNKDDAALPVQGTGTPVGFANKSSSGFDIGVRHSF
jgi:predicted porin